MGLGQGPPAYLAPLPHDAPKTKVHWESPQFLFLDLRGTNTHKALDSLPVLHFAVHLLPCSANNMSFKLQDGCLLNELTLCIFDSGYWWPTSLRLTWHKGAFCSRFFSVSSLCSSCCPLFPASPSLFLKKDVPLRAGFSVRHLFLLPLLYNFYTYTISPSSPSPHFLSSAQPLCPGPACPAADLAFVGQC